MNIAIIPARGGSVGIPGKNIIDVAGKPLIAWSIEQAKAATLVDDVFVSTDDEKIAEVSRKYGAKVIDRPAELASSTAKSEDALIHAIGVIEKEHNIEIDTVVFLQATSPIRQSEDIDNAISIFIDQKADSLFSCTPIEDHFIWEKQDGNYSSVNYDFKNRKMRQNIKPQYQENGSIYVLKPELIKKERNRLGGQIAIYEMPSWKAFQIDRRNDLSVCEYYLKEKC